MSDLDSITSDWRRFSKTRLEMLRLLIRKKSGKQERIQRREGASSAAAMHVPLSLSQQRLWFIDQLEGAGAAYNIASAVRLLGALDEHALRTALDTLVSRHEILRTVFVTAAGEPAQVIAERARFALREVDLSSLPNNEREARAVELSQEEASGRFDLSQGPLIRGALLKLAAQEHVLLVAMHHIVSDGWSMGILIRELSGLYGAYLEGRSNPLPTLPIQYADYAQWQRHWMVGEVLQKQLEYWRAHLQAAPSLLELPTDRARPAVQSYRGGSVAMVVGSELTQKLRSLSWRFDVTLYMTLYAGFAILLSRLSGQKDVVIGSSIANRSRTEVEGLIGFFVNNLALRVQLEDELSLVDLLKRTRELTLAGYAHQEVPFEQVVEALQPSRTLSHNPLFQVLFAFQNTPRSELQLSGLTFTSQSLSQKAAHFDLSLSLQDRGLEIAGALNYASDLFDRSTIERWVGYFKRVLEQMARDMDQRVGALNLLPEAEHQQVIEVFNATQRSYPQDALIHELFEAQVEKTPDAVALRYEGQQLSYIELNRRANQLARYLRAQGIGPDQLVGICVERSVEMVVGILGVLKAGGAYVPLDPGYPAERLAYLLKDASPRVVLTQARLKSVLVRSAATILMLEEQWCEIAQQSSENLDLRADGLNAHHLAYVIYTSGSTGEPKGVLVEHAGLVNYLHWAVNVYGVEGEGAVVSTPCAFDATVTSLYTPLLSGRAVVLVREGEEIEGLERLLQQARVWTLIKISPAHLRMLGERLSSQRHQCSVRAFVIGGEALAPSTVQLWQRVAPETRLINEYGPTETVVGCASYEVPAQWEGGISVPIGRPIWNTQIYILDEQRQPVPIGVVGEIFIGGVGVARGYLNQPLLTQQRFIADPFSAEADTRMYRSGDLGRWRADGTIEYVGRNDHQVKLRGYRIELGEIESQLSRHAQVKEAVVLAREDVPGEKRLVAYVTTRHIPPSIEELRTHLKGVLPEYMMPVAYVLLECLPLTANGKLDRRALPLPEGEAYVRKEYEAPQGEIEELLAGIWCELLRVDRVGRHDNFFELGGHSLLMVQLIERLRQRGLGAEIRSIFESETLRGLADTLGKGQWAQYRVPPNLIPADCNQITPEMLPLIELDQAQIERIVNTVPAGALNVQDIYPLTPLQEGILFHHLLNDRGWDTYVLPKLLALPSRAQLEKLIGALQTVIDRHDILRTAVLWEGLPRPVQVVYRKAHLLVEELELDPSRDALEQMKARMAPQLQRIELRSAPLMRLQIAQGEGVEWYALLQMHHLITDRMTQDILTEEVTAHLRGRAEDLSPPVAFRGFVAQALQNAQDGDAEAFFHRKLSDVAESTAPFGLVDVHGDGSQIEEVRQTLEARLCERVRRVARALSMSPAPLFHAAWGLVVARTSGRDDVVFGSVLSGRLLGTAGAERVMGAFINTLPLRLQMKGVTVRAMVQQTQRELVELLKYEQASLAQAQRCSGIAGTAPLFSAVLNYRHGVAARKQPSGDDHNEAQVQVLAAQERSNYPLTLSIDDLGERFRLVAQVDRHIDARRVLDYMHTALKGLVKALESTPDRMLLDLPMLPEAEHQQVTEAFNATQRAYPQDALIHELFEAQAEKAPDAVAVIHEGQQLSYAELNRRANQLAHCLRAYGIGADQLVGICLERSVELVVGILGVLKAGGAYVPLDPSYPAERLQYLLQDASPRVLLTQARLKSVLAGSVAPIITLDEQCEEVAQQPSENLDLRAEGLNSHHLAYVIYTSGSTGEPKGVMVEHAGLVNYLHWAVNAYAVEGEGTVVSSPFSFDATVTSLYTPLLSGRAAVLVREGEEIEGLERLLQQGRVWTLIKISPAHLKMLGERLSSQRNHCSVSAFVIGGEPLAPSTVQLWQRLAPETRLINEYGPTETVVGCTSYEVPAQWDGGTPVPIGRPIWNTQIYILDEQRQPVPIGVVGEIYISGVGVARGYLNRPQLTEQRFIADPFSVESQARMYRSGDLGRWRTDGTIEYMGRNDHQVKLRGYRIELGEIEALLVRHTQVKEAVALVREDAPGEKRLVAYVTGRGEAVSSDALRSHLKRSLPEYMIPAALVCVEALPLTANGKLDRRALPAPEDRAYVLKPYEAPQGEIEELLAGIWCELLRKGRVGRYDNFFDLGGHSLLAMQLLGRIRQSLGRELALRELFEFTSVQALARRLSTASQVSQRPIERVHRKQPLALSLSQQRLWFIDQLEGTGAAYHIAGAVRLLGTLDEHALRAALNSLVSRHEVLRTVFASVDGELVQVIAERAEFALREIDLSALPKTEREARALELSQEEASARFDLSQGPLIRGTLLRLSAQEHVLLVTMHHIVSDGWSMGILIRELSTLYGAYREGRSDPLPVLPIQYADYAQWQRHWLSGEVLQEQLEYWGVHLQGAPSWLELPTDRPRPAVQSYRGDSVPVILDLELTQQLKQLSRRFDATLYMTLYAGFAVLLSRLSGEKDVVIGTPVANRQRAEVEDLIGFFVNTLALRVRLEDELTVGELLKRTRELMLAGFAHQEAPFEQVVEALQPPRSLGHNPVFQIMLALHNAPHSELQLPGLKLASQELSRGTAQFDLTLSLRESGSGIVGALSYASDLFDRSTIQRWVEYFTQVLGQMVCDVGQRIGALNLLSEAERCEVVETFNATDRPYPQEALIHELFEAQVAKTPDAVAVIHEDQQLSYIELNRRANQLARYLRGQGIGADQLVGICVERSVEMVVGILGVLKAGGAYVPLDPSYPAERLKYLFKDAAPRVVLTQARLKPVLAGSAVPILTVDEQWDEVAQHSSGNLELRTEGLNAHHLAYVIYTSGSTGEPKGVMIEQCNASNLVQWALAEFSPQQLARTYFCTSINFDLSVFELFVPLAAGGTVYVAKETLNLKPAGALTLINTVPSAMKSMMSVGEITVSIQAINLAGEVLKQELVEEIFAKTSVQQVSNLFGPTETTTYSSAVSFQRGEAFQAHIGRPISNTQIYILDEQRCPVPIGVVGEIYIGGAGVARGYLNRPALTAERFIRNPFSSDAAVRMYKSGDRGRWRADGTIEYQGRNDHQVKLRGYRIELGEIESQLSRHAQVKEAVVLVREDVPGEKRLVAYVTGGGETVGSEALRSHLRGLLPEYMIPAAFVCVEALPLTANGKLDRRALPAPEDNAYALRPYEAPQGEIEELLAGIWCELLHVDRVGRQDNFFELGGHSLLIVQMIERLRQRGLGAEIRSIFESPTLAELAATLGKSQWAEYAVPPNLIPAGCQQITPAMLPLIELDQEHIDAIVSTVPGGPSNVQDIYPLTPLQEGILFHHLLNDRGGDTYVLPTLLELPSRVQLDKLIEALQAVIDRHDILRTAVLWEGLPRPVQVVYRQARLSVQELELDPSSNALEQMKARMAPQLQRLDLRTAPLMRLQVACAEGSPCYALLQKHHLMTDHVAQGILVEEIVAHLGGRTEHLPPPVAFRGFVAQALKRAQDGDAGAFFRRKLSDVEASTAPFGLVDVHGDGSQIEEVRQVLEAPLCERVRRVARALSMSPAPLFHAAWGLVVARTSGRDDVVFGSVLSGRLQGTAGADRVLGMFINTLPLRLKMKGATVTAMVQQTQRELVELLKYEQASLAQAQRCSGIGGTAPLFSAVLNYRHIKSDQNDADTGSVEAQVLGTLERSNYPLLVSVDDLGERFRLVAQVDRRIDAHRVLGYVHTALKGLVEALESTPERMLLYVPMLPEAERQEVIEVFNATHRTYPQDALIHELFEAQAEKTPDAVAVIHEGRQLSYAELNRRANQLARHLRAHGIGADQLVGIYLERSVELVVGILGVLKAGGAYVPLDPSYPAERLQYVLKDALPRVLLTQASLKSALAANIASVIALDEQCEEVAQQPSENLDLRVEGLSSHHLAYVIYTSGSTGEPKGVMVEHAGLVNYLHWAVNVYAVEGEGAVVSSSFAFDATVTSLYTPLLSGRAVVLVREGEEIEGLERLLQQDRVWTLIKISPAHLKMLGERLSAQPNHCSVSAFVIGGEALAPSTVRLWQRLSPETRLINEYGPTETVVGCTTYEVPAHWEGGSSVPIGRPIWNTQIYILDERHQPVPIGVVGEICIGGAGVARGYLNRPQLTAERFIRNPFSSDATARMYRSGDLGRWRADGTIEYVGRNDHQVKLRGYRIELGEIESQLIRHVQVKEVVVLVREDVPGQKRLVAYVTSREVQPSIEELRTHLRGVLPEYMMPAAFVLLESLPLTANGKLNRQALPAPEDDAYALKRYEAPQGEIEELLAGIWCEQLRVGRVGRRDNFFELGGHSLLIMQMIERLRQRGLGVEIRSIFESATLADLADILGKGQRAQYCAPPHLIPADCGQITPEMLPLIELDQAQIEGIVSTVPGGAENVQDIYPLTPPQEGILFHHLLNDRGGDTYVLPLLLALPSRAQLGKLIEVLQAVIDRHDILRTAVLWEGLPRPVQVVYRNAQLSVEEIKLDPTCDVLKQMKAQMAPQLQRMDLRSAPLMRLQVAQGEGSQWYALLQMHHLTTDHVAQEILVEEVLVHLRGRTEHLSIPVSFRAFVAQALNRTQDSEANAFFQRKLGDVTESTTPFGLVDVHGDGSQIEQVRQLVEARLCERVRHVARALNMSPAPLFHAVWALVVARTSGRDDVVFGTVLSGRLQGIAGADRALGMFINTLPLRLQMKGATARAVVQQTQRELVELLKYEQASLAQAQRCSGIEEAAPLFSAMLNYRHSAPVRSAEADSEDPASSIGVLANQPRTNYPIALFVDDLGVQFRLVVQVDRRIDAHRVLGYVYTALEGLVEAMESAPERAFLDLPVLPTTERHQVIEAFNATHAAYPRDMLIHELFEAQVEKTPDAVAALYKDQQLRYTELNGRANQLARYLRAYGIGPDQLVGICVERSLELVVGIWGVLKAGGAYVPLDPSYPAERLGYLLKDASPRMVLTQARFKPALAGSALPILTLEEQWDEIAQQSTANLDLRAEGLNAHHLAYVIYTSGSTGEPKGVMVEHRNLVNYAIHATRQFDVASGAGSLICTSLGFDLALTGFYPPLLCGRAVRLSAEQQDLSALSRLVGESENLAPLKLTPSHLGLLEGSLSSGQLKGRVRVLVLGGEALRAEVVRAWREHAPETRIFNHYGPTETTVGCVVHEIADELSGVIPIGRPISNTQIYILDEQRQPVPIWVVGEIYIGGAGVARGYLNRWQLTEQRFIADPFSAEPDAKIYKSGDLGRWRADGTIEYMGRNDRQVKFRGYRIELGEIEAQLIRHALVKEAVVLAREDIPGEKQLVAYVTSHETPPSIEELRAHVKGILPEYMLPSAYVLLESLPLTANGKLDRRALPMPEGEAYALKPYEAPQGEIEELLAGIWCELLRIERVGRHDNFFELGGHSLLAVQLLTRIRQSLGRELALRELFEFPSVQAQAQRLSTAEQVSQRPIERVDRNPLPALSLSERRLWLIDKLLDQLESAGEGVLAEKISAMSDDEVSDLLREAKDI